MEFLYVNLFIGILTLIFLFLKQKFSYWKRRGVPYIEPVIPFGNAKGLGKKIHISDFMVNMYQQLKPKGPIGGIYIFIRSSAVVTDLDLVRQILVKDFSTFPNRGAYYNEADDPLSAHLVNLEDDNWKNLRAKLTPTFTSGKLKMMFQTVLDVSDHLIEVLDKETADSGQLEIKDLMARFTTDVIGSVAFGIDCNSLNDKTAKFYEMGLKSFSGINFIKRFMTMSYRNLARKLHVKNIPEDVSKFYMDVVKDTVSYREKNSEVKRNDFMNLLIQMKNSKGSDSLTLNQIAAQSFVFFLAGYETSSTTLTFCMYELSLNENVQEQARKAVKESIEKHDGELNYETVNDMHYLDQCINETLRKYPPAANLQRIANKDYPVPNTKIILEKGSAVMIPIHAIHWDPEIYPEPRKYDPNRFSAEEVSKRHQYAFIPFGEGPRVCIALRFATMEIKIGLAKLLLNHKFTLDKTKTSVPLKFSCNKQLLSPAEGIYINVEKLD